MRKTSFLSLLLCFCVAACSSASVTNQFIGPADPTAEFPGDHLVGKASTYRVFSGIDQTGEAVLELDPIDVTSSLKNAKPLAGSTISYPDQSTQTTAADGTFDASQSVYASGHPEAVGGEQVEVTIAPPNGSSLTPIAAVVVALSPSAEAETESGTIPPDAGVNAQPGSRVRVPQAYIWSCNANDYELGLLGGPSYFGLKPYVSQLKLKYEEWWELQVPFGTSSVHSWFTGHIYRCGTDQPDTTNLKVRETTWYRFANNPQIWWTIWVEVINKNTVNPLSFDAIWASPDNYFFSVNRHVALSCPYYFTPAGISANGRLDPPHNAGCK